MANRGTDHLRAVLRCSRYVDEPHLVVLLNDAAVDEWLAQVTGEDSFAGLVTTLDDCLYEPAERAIVWQRIFPADGTSHVAPLLVCPDDLDFDCTVVVVEVGREGNKILWRRFGVDQTIASNSEQVGMNVRWLDAGRCLVFQVDEYRRFIEDCREIKSDWWQRG